MKRPSFQFYPGDWLNDSALRMCSVPARGLWIEMLCLMHQGSKYGHLLVNHQVIPLDNLARMIGATKTEVEAWLGELDSAGVYSKTDDGCIFSRRMIRDEELREIRSDCGKLGGNPKLLRKISKNLFNQGVNQGVNQSLTPSSLASSSPSPSKEAVALRNKTALKSKQVTDEQWLCEIAKRPAYAGIDVSREFSKAEAWIAEKPRRQMTRMFFINWLNRVEVPIRVNGVAAKPAAAPSVYSLTKVIEVKQAQATELFNRHATETGLSTSWENEQALEDYRKIKSEIKDLKAQLGRIKFS